MWPVFNIVKQTYANIKTFSVPVSYIATCLKYYEESTTTIPILNIFCN